MPSAIFARLLTRAIFGKAALPASRGDTRHDASTFHEPRRKTRLSRAAFERYAAAAEW